MLVFDDRARLGNTPGLHALLAGVGMYPHLPRGGAQPAPKDFGMGQLKSPALTAYQLCQWLIRRKDNLPVPLATCRLLLSPTAEEIVAEAALGNNIQRCTWDNFVQEAKAWRKDAGTSPQNQTFFYFGGHGVQRSRTDSVMLMQDFGDGMGGTLHRGAALENIFSAMAPTFNWPNIARTQFYFVDACRAQPESFKDSELLKVPDVMDVDVGGRDDRRAPIFFASVAGASAYALDGKPTLFGLALKNSLEGDGADLRDDGNGGGEWVVTSHSLDKALSAQLILLNKKHGADQDSRMGGIASDADLHRLDGPPAIDVAMEIDPVAALACTTLHVEHPETNAPACQLPVPMNPHPYVQQLAAGYYRLRASIAPPTPPYFDVPPKLFKASPMNRKWKVKVAP